MSIFTRSIVVLVLIFLAFSILRDTFARFAWEYFRAPEIALAFDNDNAELAYQIGNYYFNDNDEGVYDLILAKKYFERALAVDPAECCAWHQLARIDFLRGNFNEAIEKINKQIELHKDSVVSSYYVRGLIYGFVKEFDKAEADFLFFLEKYPANWAARNDLAWVYFSKGEYKKSAEQAKKGIEYNPNNTWLLTSYGVSLLNLGEKEQAKVVFERALQEARKLTKNDWKTAYPGNDPRVAAQGLKEMVQAIEFNLALVGDK